MKYDTRHIMRRVAGLTKLPESKVREVFRAVVSVGVEAMMEGDEFKLPGIGKLFVSLEGESLYLNLKTTEQFDTSLDENFVENRDTMV